MKNLIVGTLCVLTACGGAKAASVKVDEPTTTTVGQSYKPIARSAIEDMQSLLTNVHDAASSGDADATVTACSNASSHVSSWLSVTTKLPESMQRDYGQLVDDIQALFSDCSTLNVDAMTNDFNSVQTDSQTLTDDISRAD